MTRSDANRLAPGAVVDDFIVDAVLAEGGTTTTFSATSQTLGRSVSLKFFRPEAFVEDAAGIVDARKQASAVARLEHPGITPVYAAGEWGGGLYVASAMPAGPTLEEQLHDGTLTPDATATIITSLSAALEHAHEHGIVHRDLRPDCVTVGRWGHPLVRDFGVTRTSGRTGLLTRAEVMASLRYTAPEIILGRAPTPATDVYGLAAVAVACLTGAPPYRDRPAAQYVMFRTAAPAPRLAARDGAELVPLSRVVADGMALDPAARPTSAQFAARFAQAVAALPAAVRTAGTPLEAREVDEHAAPLPAPGSTRSAAPAAAPAAVAMPAPPAPADVTRIEQRRPVLAATETADERIGWKTWAGAGGITLTVGILAALVGFLTAPSLPAEARLGPFAITPPKTWTVTDRGAQLRLSSQLGGSATLAVTGPRLPGAPLPAGLVGQVKPAPALVGGTPVVVYDGGGPILIAAPTAKGALYARCEPVVGAQRCAALVTTAVKGPAALSPAPNPKVLDALRTAMSKVQDDGAVAAGEMQGKAADRSSGATSLAGTLRTAAEGLTVEGVDPGTASALAVTAKALASEAGSLEELSSALDRKSKAAERAAVKAAVAADGRVRSSLAQFAAAGYPVKG